MWPPRLLLLLSLAALSGRLASCADASPCQAQLDAILSTKAAQAGKWLDPATPATACTLPLCVNNNFDVCNPATGGGPKENLVLVFSDEFEDKGRDLSSRGRDPRWTADDLFYFPTQNLEVYKAGQVRTEGGSVVVKLSKGVGTSPTQQPSGEVWDVSKAFKSGLVTSWNKFCYTGGYVEASVQLPGDGVTPGLWPAFWMMGNLGRAGYMKSTEGFWPYSYSTCGAGSGGQPWSLLKGQTISACPDPSGVDRSKWGMAQGVGRAAPEFDVFEVSVYPGVGGTVSQTLQMAPLAPPGTTWVGGPGVKYPGAVTRFATAPNSWRGPFNRPGNEYQDSISAVSQLDTSFFTGFHKWGLDWKPGEYIRWYIDGKFVYEVNKQALSAVTNSAGQAVGDRIIPLEPMYIMFNLGMSYGFSERFNLTELTFPAEMKIDYIRLYQSPGAINVGCSPPGYPTEQYIACHKDTYAISKDDKNNLITATCASGAVALARGGALAIAAAGAAAAWLLLGA